MRAAAQGGGLDRFRLAAALLVVSIHTGPLLSLDERADFVLTHILARVAVPFFFLCTGFFLLPRSLGRGADREPLGRFFKKTGLLYLGAVLLYLPVNLYAGHFAGPGGWPRLLRGLFFDGTFYHLWYLPASLLGVAVLVLLSRRLSPKSLWIVVAALYLVGLFGDSYYGFTQRSAPAVAFYELLFAVSAYTRNGVFFAPLFLLMGAGMRGLQGRFSRRHLAVGLGTGLMMLLGEGLLLGTLLPGRHDSMYVFLVPVVACLFLLLLAAGGRASPRLRRLSLLVYLLHPLCIIGVRGGARLAGLTPWLVECSAAHYLAVCAASLSAALLLDRLAARLFPPQDPTARAWAEIDLDALGHNVRLLQNALPPGCGLMAVLKADAYGHGAVRVAREARALGVRAFCVATAAEGAALRKQRVRGEILVLGYTHDTQLPLLTRYRLTQTAVDAQDARRLGAFGPRLPVHLKIDTGMHRLGERYDHWEEIARVMRLPGLEVRGLFTHLCVADSREAAGVAYTREQLRRFEECVQHLRNQGLSLPALHVQSSYGLVNYPGLGCDWARVGIALYGMLSRDGEGCPGLRPVLSLKARVECVHELRQSEPLGYGLDYAAPRDMRVASVAIGYGDGLPRALSGKGEVLLHGKRARMLGRICMDRLLVDVSGIPQVRQGDVAVLIGRQGDQSLSACRLAAQGGTISNEILAGLAPRLARVYTRSSATAKEASSPSHLYRV